MTEFIKTVLFTDADGRARFREEAVALTEGTPQAMLSPLMPSGGLQLRQSPVGFRSSFHCTGSPQWLFVLRGRMEIAQKDLGLALQMAHDHGIAMPVTGLVAQLLAKVYGVYDDALR